MPISENKFRLPPDVFVRRKGKKVLLLNPTAPDWIVTNTNGAAALQLCDGQRTVGEISKIVSNLFHRDTTDELETFFDDLTSQSSAFFSIAPQTPAYLPHKLKTVHLNLTSRCNLKCIYCYADERTRSTTHLQYKEYLGIVDSISNLCKDSDIVLTGGEPLLASYALDVASYAKQSGNHVHILTNGTLIDENNASRIAELADLIKVSLD